MARYCSISQYSVFSSFILDSSPKSQSECSSFLKTNNIFMTLFLCNLLMHLFLYFHFECTCRYTWFISVFSNHVLLTVLFNQIAELSLFVFHKNLTCGKKSIIVTISWFQSQLMNSFYTLYSFLVDVPDFILQSKIFYNTELSSSLLQ